VTSGPTGNAPAPARPPSAPRAARSLPVLGLWLVPLAFVAAYGLVVLEFFHDQARWTDAHFVGIVIVLLGVTLAFSLAWFGAALVASRTLGVLVPLGVLLAIVRIPGLNRHAVVEAPVRPDTPRETWGRFGIVFVVTLGFELIYMITVFQRGDLAPRFALDRPFAFFVEEFLAGLLLAIILSPAGPYLMSRARLRITDSLEFPFLWLMLLLLVVGGITVLAITLLPGVTINAPLFLTSILFYAPAAWFVALAYCWHDTAVQNLFFAQAWKRRSDHFHFGRMSVTDEPEGTTTTV